MKREQMSVELNPAPDFIEDDQDLANYYNSLFQSLLRLLTQMERYISQGDEATPVDFNNQLQFLTVCLIQKLVDINKKVQKRTVSYVKKKEVFYV